jgi:hypothetical protein
MIESACLAAKTRPIPSSRGGWKFARFAAGGSRIRTLGPAQTGHRFETASCCLFGRRCPAEPAAPARSRQPAPNLDSPETICRDMLKPRGEFRRTLALPCLRSPAWQSPCSGFATRNLAGVGNRSAPAFLRRERRFGNAGRQMTVPVSRKGSAFSTGDREFESGSLQRTVRCEPGFREPRG